MGSKVCPVHNAPCPVHNNDQQFQLQEQNSINFYLQYFIMLIGPTYKDTNLKF